MEISEENEVVEMASLEENENICKSFFKDKSADITSAQFTRAFAEMINRIEKNRKSK